MIWLLIRESETCMLRCQHRSNSNNKIISNDPAAHLHDILEYQNAVALVKEYVDQHPDTFMISTSDHETGGLSLARQVSAAYPKYLWFPDVLANVKSSTAALAKELASGALDVQKAISELGISDATKEELSAISKSIHSTSATDKYLSDMISIRAELGVIILSYISGDMQIRKLNVKTCIFFSGQRMVIAVLMLIFMHTVNGQIAL